MKNHTGTVFSIPNAHNDQILGRILFDCTYFYKKKLLSENGNWMAFEGYSVLMELYELDNHQGKHILIPGVNTSMRNIETGLWPTIGYEKVDLDTLDFPEFLSVWGANSFCFHKGEVKIKFNVTSSKYDAPNVELYPCSWAALNLHDAFYFAKGEPHKFNRKREQCDALDLTKKDLRFAPFRNEIYDLIGEDPQGSYFALAQKHGVPIERFSAYM